MLPLLETCICRGGNRHLAQLTGNFITSLAIIDILIKAPAPGDR